MVTPMPVSTACTPPETVPTGRSPPSRAASSTIQKPNDIVLVIPAHNDETTLGSLIIKARPLVSRVIVVDDCSHDRTVDVAELSGAEVIHFREPSGKGAAGIEGLKWAYWHGCSIAILIDGDARYKTREIPWLISPIQGGNADVVIGSRYLEDNGSTSPRQRIIQNSIHPPASEEIPPEITDPLSGFIAMDQRALQDLNFSLSPYNFRQKFMEHLISRNLRIHEVAVTERRGIPKKVGWDDAVKVMAALPAFNEETHVATIITHAEKYVDAVLIVDDGSTDTTAAIARRIGAYVVSHGTNGGYGAALQTIFSTAKTLNLEAVVILDSDGQHNPEDIPRLLAGLGSCKADVVIGSRFLEGSEDHIPAYRKAGMKVLDGATRVAGVANISDSQSGFRAYGRNAIEKINLAGNGMSAGSEILIQIADNNLKIVEVPIKVRYDIEETSSQNPVRHGVSVLYRIIGMISYRRPLPTFGIPGVIFIVGGLIAEIWVFAELYTSNDFHYIIAIASGFILITGMLLGVVALILNYLVVFVERQKNGG